MIGKRLAWQGGKCRVPMWVMGAPAGFCDEQAFGEQLPAEILYRERHYSLPTQYYSGTRIPYCYGPCCPGHGGPKADEPRFFQDGLTREGRVMWCCVGPDFINLQESPAGFDGNPFIARKNYVAALAAGTQSAETSETSAPTEGCQSGPNDSEGNAPKVSQ